ncbi:high affinity nitrate transporter 2.5, partial [Quercus suber]
FPHSPLILLAPPAVQCSSIASSPTSFLLVRFFTGFSLATFVSTQFWMNSKFSAPVVGTANGVACGWGNLGGGAAQLIIPIGFGVIHDIGVVKFTAWRIAFFFFLPALFQDMPDGNFHGLKKSGEKARDKFSWVFYYGITNYRGWILALTYGYCFGVELAVDNIIAEYFYDRFNLNLSIAGIIAASFGLANLFSQPGGGILSDIVAKRFRIRGRLWNLWVVQTLGGGTLSGSIIVMIAFSVFAQAACGLTFGVVPFVSRRSLGVVFGMTGGGGNVGAVVTQLIFFRGSKYSKQTGITLMCIMIICCTLPLFLIYFPQWGGMFCGPSKKANATEEEYYLSEWKSNEKEKDFHLASLNGSRHGKVRMVVFFFCEVPLPLSHYSFSFKACTGARLGSWFDLGMVVGWDRLMVGLDQRRLELRWWV